MLPLVIAITLFVGTHFLMSHPLRAAMVKALGTNGFLAVYSLISIVLISWASIAYGDAPNVSLWMVYFSMIIGGHIIMALASILLVGSFLGRNPALPGADSQLDRIAQPKGVFRITRHPMMWAIGLWAMSHILMRGTMATLILAGGIGFLALVGAWAQDRKKARLIGAAWTRYTAMTSYWPRLRWPGIASVIAGLVAYAAFVWLHPMLFGVTTRLWEFIL